MGDFLSQFPILRTGEVQSVTNFLTDVEKAQASAQLGRYGFAASHAWSL